MTNPNNNPLHGQIETPSMQSLANCLGRTALLFSRQLTTDEGKVWMDLVGIYSSKAIEFAFENWQRNGRFFPKPKEIIDLCESYKQSQLVEYRPCGQCYDGWLYLQKDGTPYRRDEDPHIGAKVKRCECWYNWRTVQKEAAA